MGITHFPCFLYDNVTRTTQPTVNLLTAVSAIKQAEVLGYTMSHCNFPSSTSFETIPIIHEYGGTHGEPGHALTGTIPSNQNGSQPEKIAMLYLTEISHQFADRSYCYGGGYYNRSQVEAALVFEPQSSQKRLLPFHPNEGNNIDYYFQLEGLAVVGSPVVMAFRTQLFVTRSDVALIEGISTSQPRLLGLFDTQGKQIQR